MAINKMIKSFSRFCSFIPSLPPKGKSFVLAKSPLNLFRNKKGQEIAHPLFLIFMFTIVAGGIVVMAGVFYGNPYDIRNIEANLLGDKIADCISYAGRINENLISNGEIKDINFLESCHLNFNSEEDEFFYEATFYKFEDIENYFLKIDGGNLNLVASCAIKEESKNLPTCAENSFYSLDNSDNQYVIKILTAVRKLKQNV
jgi:hypothetical protein